MPEMGHLQIESVYWDKDD